MVTKAILFDYDGVITDTERFRIQTLNKLLQEKGLHIEEDDESIVGRKTHHFLAETFPELTAEEQVRLRALWRQARLEEPTPLVQGAKETMAFAQQRFVVAIVTGSAREAVQQTLDHYAIEGFSEIISGEDFSSSKPNPECYRIALERLQVKPAEAIIIEDSIAGVQAGKNTGCTVYGLGTYHDKKTLVDAGADKYFENHKQLLRALTTL